jgi:glyceraldehyde-3-phosphate dehydrogenase (NADP+)
MQSQSSFIDGFFQKPNSQKLKVKNKFSQELLAEVSLSTEEEVQSAIISSKKGFLEYSKFSSQSRHDLLKTLVEKFKLKRNEFAVLISKEAGKPISYAQTEISRCITTLDLAVEESLRISGESIPMDFANAIGKKAMTQKLPSGPVLAISPFNFPLNLALHKIAPALACGCSVVLKPSLFTPLVALKFAELVHESGFPKGVLNVVICENDLSEELVKSEEFSILSFTGSPKVGWMLKSMAGKKKVILELGGNAAVIVDKDANISNVAKDIAIGSFLYSGQICISTQRVLVHTEIYDEFKKEFIKASRDLVCGDPKDESTIVGPLIDSIHVKRIVDWQNQALSSGANLLTEVSDDVSNNVLKPIILENVDKDQVIWKEEVFGPVAILKRFNSFSESIEISNDSKYGLQVGVFTNSLENIKSAFNEIDVAAVIINSVPGFRIDHMPYGGIKDSGLGREGIKYAINDMTYEKLLVF